MIYKVAIVETLEKVVLVRAGSEQDAIDRVYDRYRDCDIILTADDHTDTDLYCVDLLKDEDYDPEEVIDYDED